MKKLKFFFLSFLLAFFAMLSPAPAFAQVEEGPEPTAIESAVSAADSVAPAPASGETPATATEDEPGDPTEPGLSKDQIVNRYVDWFNAFNVLLVLAVGWVFKYILRKSIDEETKAKIGKWAALVLFVPGFIISLIVQSTSGEIDIITAIGVFIGVATVLGLHTIFVNPIENLFKKAQSKPEAAA